MCELLERITKAYDGNVRLREPLAESAEWLPGELAALLAESNGVMETAAASDGSVSEVGWIVYPFEEICGQTGFFKRKYFIDGVVFSVDDAGNPFYIAANGRVFLYDCGIAEEICRADSLKKFFRALM